MKKFHLHVNAHAGIFKKIGMDPYVDWFFILLISFLLALVFIGFGVSFFLSINNANPAASGTSISTAAGTLNKNDLTKLITTFENKKVAEVLFQAGYHGSADPSASSTLIR